MKFGKYILVVTVAVCAVVVCSCHKDEEISYNYLDGTLAFDLDEYLSPYTTVVLTPRGVTHPNGGEIYYIWYDDAGSDSDTTDVFTYEFLDTLKSYTISVSARADGFLTSSASRTTTIVKGGLDGTGSITDSLGSAIVDLNALDSIVDARDGKTYYYAANGGTDWFVQNLAYAGTADAPVGVAYKGSEPMLDVFGGYYSYNEAIDACPEGWRLPTIDDWDNIVSDNNIGTLMANVYFNTEKMWEFWPQVKISNSTKFTAIPTGYMEVGGMEFSYVQEMAVFWTATEDDDNSDKAEVFQIVVDKSEPFEAYMYKDYFACSVRCVR